MPIIIYKLYVTSEQLALGISAILIIVFSVVQNFGVVKPVDIEVVRRLQIFCSKVLWATYLGPERCQTATKKLWDARHTTVQFEQFYGKLFELQQTIDFIFSKAS